VILLRMLESVDRQGIVSWEQLEDWVGGRPAVPLPPLNSEEGLRA